MHKTIRYDNGLRLILKKIDFVRSVSAGVWVGTGSAYENQTNNGISHFIEHMLFKGTQKRSAFEIADSIDRIGAQINAFTSKECTCFYTKSIDEHLEKCLDVLSDMFFNSAFAEEELNREKKVVIEEISMIEDTPEDVCHELLAAAYFGDNPLSRSIIGTADNVNSFTKDMLKEYMIKHYCPENTVISIAGNIDIDQTIKMVEKYFVANFSGDYCYKHIPAPKHDTKSKFVSKIKQVEQASVAIAFPSVTFNSPMAQPMMLLSSVLGGGMSSRLFQKVREELGLAYSVYTYPSAYINNGMFTVYIGTNPQNIELAMETIVKELDKVKKEGITKDEFLRGKEQLKGSFILGQENTSSIMTIYGKLLLLANEEFNLDKRLTEINAVTQDDVNRVIEQTFDYSKASISCVSSQEVQDLTKYLRN